MITLDVQALTAYFLDGTTFSAETRRAMAEASGATDRGPAVIAPWQFVPAAPLSAADTLLKILGTANAFNLNDPSLDRPGVDDNFRTLFTLYNGLGLLGDLADLASANQVEGTSRQALARKLDGLLAQPDEFLADNTVDGISLIKGLKSDEITTSAFIPPLDPGPADRGRHYQRHPRPGGTRGWDPDFLYRCHTRGRA
jgi:hypothetical protein